MASPTDSRSQRTSSLGRIALTDRTVRALKPPTTGRLDVWDEDNPGFGLRISAEGRRTWILMYRMGKKLRRLTLGRFPTLGLAAAREKATDALREVGKGQDPGQRKIEERRAETFAELAREYIERHASKKRSGREDITASRAALAAGGAHPQDLARGGRRSPWVFPSSRKKGPHIAHAQKAIERDWLEANPCHMVKPPGDEKQRERVLNEDEIRLVWKALDDESPLIAALFRIPLLTAQRGAEVHGASWSEFPHRVPLSPQAVRILKTWREEVDDHRGSFRAAVRKARTSPMPRRRSSESFGPPGSTSEGMTCGAPRRA